jgi:hypothetical protein
MEGSNELRYSVIGVTADAVSIHTHLDQIRRHRRLIEVLNEAWRAVHLDPLPWVQDMVDGVLILIPANISLARLLEDFIRELEADLKLHNRFLAAEDRLRLRVSMHSGRVNLEPSGPAGGAIILAYRLLDAPQLRAALDDQPAADLAVIISNEVYQDVVVQSYGNLDKRRFQHIEFHTKTGEEAGWLYVPKTAKLVVESESESAVVADIQGDIVGYNFDGQEFDPPPPPSRK